MFIAKTGWDLLREGMRVLLDASLDAKTLGKVHRILEQEPLLVNVRSLTGRNAGRYRFIEADVALRTQDLEQAQKASERLETAIREQVPHVDRVLIHSEPTPRTCIRYGVPLASPDGKVSEHFGEAPYFALVTIRTADGSLEQQAVYRNPYTEVPKAKGIRVAEWLVKNKRDVVLTKESLKGRGPQYVLSNAGVELRPTHARTLQEALTAAAANGFLDNRRMSSPQPVTEGAHVGCPSGKDVGFSRRTGNNR
jgi:predicted Fe-Mo cluster-binding NifX family protein